MATRLFWANPVTRKWTEVPNIDADPPTPRQYAANYRVGRVPKQTVRINPKTGEEKIYSSCTVAADRNAVSPAAVSRAVKLGVLLNGYKFIYREVKK